MKKTTSSPKTRKAVVFQQDQRAGLLQDEDGGGWSFTYDNGYRGMPISLTLPVRDEPYTFSRFPPVFEGLLPEGVMKEALLRRLKIDKDDFFSQLLAVGADLVGSITVFPES